MQSMNFKGEENNMRLRKLERKDAPLMLEWMHDKSVVEDLRTNFLSKTLEDCTAFIELSQNDKDNLHFAITDDLDEYLGTASLKHIKDKTAEFGIAVRSIAMGKGYSKKAMEEILDKGFKELNLQSIYWCLAPPNKRAIRFYEKNGYQQVGADTFNISGGGVQRRTDSTFLLVSGHKKRRGKQYQKEIVLTQLKNAVPLDQLSIEKEESKWGL